MRQRTDETAIRIALEDNVLIEFAAGAGAGGSAADLYGAGGGDCHVAGADPLPQSVLFGVTTSDLGTYAAVTFLLCLVWLIA